MMTSAFVAQAVLSGVIATVALDLWQRLLKLLFGIPPTNWAIVGRWFAHLPRGRFVHAGIAETPAVAGELALGWAAHYLIGVVYGFVYLGIVVLALGGAPSLLNGLVFGACSVVVPWFVMQPGLGLGVMARKAPNPTLPRWLALAAHSFYGVALYVGAAAYRLVA